VPPVDEEAPLPVAPLPTGLLPDELALHAASRENKAPPAKEDHAIAFMVSKLAEPSDLARRFVAIDTL
jgi:hypothetical protein